MSLLEFCRWVQFSDPLIGMRSLWWFFPVVATIHLLGLTVIGGAVLLVDLRLLGFGVTGASRWRNWSGTQSGGWWAACS